jgi:hypothetical protein
MKSDFDIEVAVTKKPVTRYVTLRYAAQITGTNADTILDAIRKHGGWENNKFEITRVRRL